MSEFTGMALYSQSDIKATLTNYKIGLDRAKVLLVKLIKEAEDNWQPSWWDKLLCRKTLHDKYNYEAWYNYLGWLIDKKYVTLSDADWDIIEDYIYDNGFRKRLNLWGEQYNQITNLYGSGRDCYLIPAQAKFVNKFKDMEVL